MGRNNYFQFKQFKIIQEKAAMKVGTDGVLLGSWVNVSGAKSILDVGTGTGVIALMLAQRSEAQITGIEIEKMAAEEAAENAFRSPWDSRISIKNMSFQQFTVNTNQTFNLIVSNPPFFINNQKSKNSNLAIAKHNDLLPFSEMLSGSLKLLAENGRLALILPVEPAKIFIELAQKHRLFLNRLTRVKPNSKKEVHRYLMEFSKIETELETDELTIHKDDGSDFTSRYKNLTREFYLNF